LKICVVSDPYYPYPSGVSEYTHYLAKHLRLFGHEVKILTTHYPHEENERRVTRIGRVLFIPMNQSFATLSTGLEIPRRVKEYLKKEKFDIIHMNGPFPPSISFFALHYSTSLNICTFHTAGFKPYKFGSSVVSVFFKKYINKMDGLIAVSTAARDAVASYFPGEYEIIPNGIDVDIFNNRVSPASDLPETRPKILYLGRLDQRKGLVQLLKAMPLVKKKINNVLLIVVGKGPLEKYCRALVKFSGLSDHVVFKGYVSRQELPRYYAACDVYCSPALGGESFGIVLLEAMAVGKPVAASRITGYDQVIKDNYNGVLFNPTNHEDIAGTLIKLLDDRDLRDRLCRAGHEFAKNYTWEKVAERIQKLYWAKIKNDIPKNIS